MRDDRPPLGRLSVDEFMRRYWQREPLLIRQAFPGFVAPVPPERLFELAGSDDAQSRLIATRRGRWSLRHGPIEAGAMPSRRTPKWTVLVQGVDALDDDVHALMSRFRFVPDARLDDLMISFATDGGGVGPHQDFYDVFLIQAHGRRRWRVGPPCDEVLVPDMPVKILAHFAPDREWVLEPGDMLYLPPMWAHDGVALGECMTYSVGFRTASRHELLRAFLADAADAPPPGPDTRYRDPGARPARNPARMPSALLSELGGWLRGWRPDPARIDDFIGRYITEPKPNVWFEHPARRSTPQSFAARVARDGVVVDRRSRLVYRGTRLYFNGESFSMPRGGQRLLRKLADERALPSGAFAGAPVDPALLELLHAWSDAGWLHPGRARGAHGSRRDARA